MEKSKRENKEEEEESKLCNGSISKYHQRGKGRYEHKIGVAVIFIRQNE